MAPHEPKSNVKIISDGTIFGTKCVFIRSDGVEEEIEFIQSVAWSLSLQGKFANATIKISEVQLDATLSAELLQIVQGPKPKEN